MRITGYSILMLLLLFVFGCSSSGSPVDVNVEQAIIPGNFEGQSWNWGSWLFDVSEAHNSIDILPMRETAWHFNVLKFVEQAPCSNCLQIGNLQTQPDGTFKLDVILSHPFPGMPRYTGFDVRGVVVFPATRYWRANIHLVTGELINWGGDFPPFYFSWHEDDCGAGVLNADGFSYYFWPGFDLGYGYEAERFNYQLGKYATADFPDSMVNPYLEFNDGSERRMFKTTDTIKRTYHLKLPPGAFSFGYIVDVSWAPPLTLPVTDPAQDFPVWANVEDPIIFSFDQYRPMNPHEGGSDADHFFAKVHFRQKPDVGYPSNVFIYAPDIRYWAIENDMWFEVAQSTKNTSFEIAPDEYEAEVKWAVEPYPASGHPYIDGKYLALLLIRSPIVDPEPDECMTLRTPVQLSIVELDLQTLDY